MDWAASTTPPSTSDRDDSTIRAIKGAAEITRGGIAPRTPIFVPTRNFVKSSSKIIRIIKGMDRPMLIIQPTMRLHQGRSQMPPGRVTISSTPRGRPMI